MTASILLRSSPSPSPSPSPASTPLPALQPDLSSSSSSNSGSCLDLHRASSAPSTRHIRFAPLPEPDRDFPAPSSEQPEPTAKSAAAPFPAPPDDGFVALSPSVSLDSSHSSARSTPTIRVPPHAHAKSGSKLLRFLRRPQASCLNSSPHLQSASLPASRDPSPSSLTPSTSSLPSSPSFWSPKLPRFATEDILTGTKSLFRTRSGSSTASRPARPLSPPPQSLHRSASAAGTRQGSQGSAQSNEPASPAARKRRSSSSALAPGAGGGRHGSSVKMVSDVPPRPSTAPNSPLIPQKMHVRMLNGRVYGAKRYAAQTLANPFANVREEPEFVEWGYGGMGSVHASAGIGNDMWKGLQRGERGGALLAGSSFTSPSAPAVTAGGGRGSGAHATSLAARRRMSEDVPECGMGNVSAGGGEDEDDGSGMAWLKKRRAEREAKARMELEAKEPKSPERKKSGDSIDASMYASTASTSTSLTACTSVATDLTTPLTSRSPSVIDMTLTSSPSPDSCELPAASPGPEADHGSNDEREHHILTAVRIPISSNKHGHSHAHGRTPLSDSLLQLDRDSGAKVTEQPIPLSPVDTESTSMSSVDDDEEQDDVDDKENEAQDIGRKTAVGAGVEKISRHVDVVPR